MNNNSSKKNNIIPHAFSFLLPVMLVLLIYFANGIYPGSSTMVVTYDLRAQLLPLYGYLSRGGPGFDSYLYSMSGALGGGFFGTLALYISPFDLIYSLIPVRFLPTAIYFMIVFKIGLCGLFMSFYLKRNPKFSINNIFTVTLSCCYALMSYNMVYSMSPMWYDAVMCLPLLSLMIEKIITGIKCPGFIPLMAFCIISDYYMAYMVVIALILYFVFRLAEEGESFKSSFQAFLSFAIHGILSGGISLFVVIPVVYDFRRGKFAEGVVTEGDFIKNSLTDVLHSFKPQSYSGLDFNASPNVFCGSLILIFSLIWFVSGKKNMRSRITGMCIIVLYFLSFIFGPLDRAWHGFKEPVGFSCRYAFTFVFFLICFASRGIWSLKEINLKISSSMIRLIYMIVILYTFVELYINGAYIIARIGTESGYTYSDEFYRYCDISDELIPYVLMSDPDTYGRLITNYKFSSYDGALFGYDGISRFSSSYNYKISRFLRKMGTSSIYHTSGEKGITPPVASLFNGKYYLSYFIDQSDFYKPISEEINKYTLYENEYCLPLAFEYDPASGEPDSDFSDDPFENINTVYKELSGADSEIFSRISVLETDAIYENIKNARSNKTVDFTSEKPGHYYYYVEYIADDTEEIVETYYGTSTVNIRDAYLDGYPIGNYGNNKYSYIEDLGIMYENENHSLTLFSSGSMIGDVFVYYYDEDAFKDIVSTINGCDLKKINNKSIEVDVSSASQNIILSLPYEDGYMIYLDGVRTEYTSYRDSYILVHISPEARILTIKYCPPGLIMGIVFSVISLLTAFVYVHSKGSAYQAVHH